MVKNLNVAKDLLKSICLVTKHLEIKDLIKKHKFWINKYGHFALDKNETEIFYRVLKKTNIDKKVSVHSLRYSFVPLEIIGKIL